MGKAFGVGILTFVVCIFVEVVAQAYNLMFGCGILAALAIITGVIFYCGSEKK